MRTCLHADLPSEENFLETETPFLLSENSMQFMMPTEPQAHDQAHESHPGRPPPNPTNPSSQLHNYLASDSRHFPMQQQYSLSLPSAVCIYTGPYTSYACSSKHELHLRRRGCCDPSEHTHTMHQVRGHSNLCAFGVGVLFVVVHGMHRHCKDAPVGLPYKPRLHAPVLHSGVLGSVVTVIVKCE